MKQHITIEQLQELSSDAIDDKLAPWCDMREYGYELTIGQMIEFLNNEYNALIVTTAMRKLHNNNAKWHVAKTQIPANPIKEQDFTNSDELCDALWEAVKFILEKQI